MKKSEKVVIGKYKNPEDVKAALQRLERDGYARDDVSLYTNNSNLTKFEETYDIDMLADETKTVNDTDNESFWDKVKHMVSYDHDEKSDLSDDEAELVDPYKEDIQEGYTIIAVRKRKESNKTTKDEGTILYETKDEMNSAEVIDVSDTAYDNGDFHSVYETDQKRKDKEQMHFDDPEDFESDVTGRDYIDSDEG